MEKPAARSPVPDFFSRHAATLITVILVLIVLGVLTLCGGLAYLLIARSRPVTLPAPTGTYPVGRTIISWKDARPDLLAEGTPKSREYVVFLWYPAQIDSTAKIAPYLPKDWTQARTNDQGMGAVFQQDPSTVQAHAYQDAPLAESATPFPVLIFEPGYGPIATDYTTLAEDLASYGYVVAGITPLESAPVAVLPDGTVITRTPAGSLPETTGASFEQAANQLIATWISDMRSTWTKLHTMNRDPGMWQGRLDMAKTGFFGHSFGGAAAINTCNAQSECKAAANLDGTLYGPVLSDGFHKPTLLIWAQKNPGASIEKLSRSGPAEVQTQVLNGARHYNFTDQSLVFDPLLHLAGLVGPANPAETLKTVRIALREFFDTRLK